MLDRRCCVTVGDLLCSRESLQEKRGDEVRDGNSWNCAHWLGRQGIWLREERRRKKGGRGRGRKEEEEGRRREERGGGRGREEVEQGLGRAGSRRQAG